MTYLIVYTFILLAVAQNNTCIFYEGNPGPICRSYGCASLNEGCQTRCRCEGHFLYIFPDSEQIVTDIETCEKNCLSNVNCGAFNFWPDKHNFTEANDTTFDLTNENNFGLCEIGLSVHEMVEESSNQGQAFVCAEAVPTGAPTFSPVQLCDDFEENCRQNGCANINGRCQTTCMDTQSTLFSLDKEGAKVRRVSDKDACENLCLNDEHCVAFNYFLMGSLCHFGTPVKSADVRYVDIALVRSGLCVGNTETTIAPSTIIIISTAAPTTPLPSKSPSISPSTPLPSASPSIAITTTTRDEHNSVHPSKTPLHFPTYETSAEPSTIPTNVPSTQSQICDFPNTQQAVTCLQKQIQSQIEEFNELSQRIEERAKNVQSICSARYHDISSQLLNITTRSC